MTPWFCMSLTRPAFCWYSCSRCLRLAPDSSLGVSPHHYELEFIGYGDAAPVIVFSSTAFGSGKRLTLSPENYTLENFSQRARAVDLAFRNPDDLGLPSSFGLVGTAGRAFFKSGSMIVEGSFKCDY